MSAREQIRTFVTTNFYVPDPDALSDTASFLDAGIVDSTGVLEIVAFLETEFDLKVDDAEVLPENLDSIANLTAFVERKRA